MWDDYARLEGLGLSAGCRKRLISGKNPRISSKIHEKDGIMAKICQKEHKAKPIDFVAQTIHSATYMVKNYVELNKYYRGPHVQMPQCLSVKQNW